MHNQSVADPGFQRLGKDLLFGKILAENRMKMKGFGPRPSLAPLNFCDPPQHLVDHLQIQDSAMYVPPPLVQFLSFSSNLWGNQPNDRFTSQRWSRVRPGNPGSVTVSFCYLCRKDIRQFAQD